MALARAPGRAARRARRDPGQQRLDRRDPGRPYFLAPCDLQAIKASGVTFATSLLERVIEEQARGDAGKADAIRAHDQRA